ncbi:hypothetical protein BDV98DRAFT_262493 [Pterulicium gracile]|uniref:Uncharacterized protein n=1 Tax=Pterulicium gracile TaxID=1884261 RepID=A0A5C3Q5N1_9AGAR|nr:hypothetical protein BDV98DRAFT_262493 [Pterula gracilis]
MLSCSECTPAHLCPLYTMSFFDCPVYRNEVMIHCRWRANTNSPASASDNGMFSHDASTSRRHQPMATLPRFHLCCRSYPFGTSGYNDQGGTLPHSIVSILLLGGLFDPLLELAS